MKNLMRAETTEEMPDEQGAGTEKKCPSCGHVHQKPDGTCSCGCEG